MKTIASGDPLSQKINRVVAHHGCVLWGVEWAKDHDRDPMLKVLCDHAQSGITVGLCHTIAHDLRTLLHVECPDCSVEVSSPGLDRLFFNWSQHQDYLGHTIRCELGSPPNLEICTGVMVEVQDQHLVLQQADGVRTLLRSDILRSRLVPNFPRGLHE